MKKALALGAFALVMALPLVSSATSLSSAFKTSSTGTSAIAIGDTIQFEISVTVDNLLDITTLFFSVSGDTVGAAGSSANAWAGVNHVTTNWEWNYKTGSGSLVKFDTNGTIASAEAGTGSQLNGSGASGSYGFFGTSKTGKGVGSMVGTVTVTANATGIYEGGGFLAATDAFANNGGAIATTVSTAAFTVVPEPGTAVLMLLGLGGLGVMGRKNR